jgi:quinol monooxygenase YgiN
MPSDDSGVGDALSHQSLQVSRDDPGPRPMIAVLDARPGLAGRFYLDEVYASAASFAEHLLTQPVHDFIASVPTLSTAQPGSLVQLDEITVG